MQKAVISGDIISSTSLSVKDKTLLENSLKKLLKEIKNKFGVFGRVIKGDYLEFVIPEPQNALRVALAIKSFIKSVALNDVLLNKAKSRIKLFKMYGVRLAIGYGELERFDSKKGIIDGEAIYLSGRLISGISTHNEERAVIKNTLYFSSSNKELNEKFEPVFTLLDVLVSKATARQCEVLYLKLLGDSETIIAAKLNINQSAVNQRSTSLGWNSIEKAVDYFSNTIKKT